MIQKSGGGAIEAVKVFVELIKMVRAERSETTASADPLG